MKALIAVLFVMPVLAFGSTCYKATAPTYGAIPAQLCLDSITRTSENELSIVSNEGFPSVVTITETSRHNEDRVNFTAMAVLTDVWNSGCEDGFKATLKIKSQLVFDEISPENLDVSIETEQTNDTCHSKTQHAVVKYQIAK